MHVLSLKKIKSFYKVHAESKDSLLALYKLLSHQDFENPDKLRAAFPQMDYVKPFHVFNIGRAYRLIAVIHFNTRKVYIRHVLTHREYDRGKWKDK
jgi:mRNA interferase HigB